MRSGMDPAPNRRRLQDAAQKTPIGLRESIIIIGIY